MERLIINEQEFDLNDGIIQIGENIYMRKDRVLDFTNRYLDKEIKEGRLAIVHGNEEYFRTALESVDVDCENDFQTGKRLIGHIGVDIVGIPVGMAPLLKDKLVFIVEANNQDLGSLNVQGKNLGKIQNIELTRPIPLVETQLIFEENYKKKPHQQQPWFEKNRRKRK